jgi:serine phosphatase RsbU (regulator of sigma subunit)
MQKKILIIIAVLFSSGILFSQNRKADSLLQLLKSQKEDTNKVNTLFHLTRAVRRTDPDKAFGYIKEGIVLSEKLGFKRGVFKFHNIRGNILSVTGNNDSALSSYHTALDIATEINEKAALSMINNNIGLVHFNRGDYNKALEYYTTGLKQAEKNSDNYYFLQSLNNIAGVYYSQKNTAKTLEYTKKILERSSKTGEKLMHARALSNIASVYEQMKEYKTAIDFNLEAIKEYEAMNEKGVAYIYGNTSNLYHLLNDPAKAESYANKALKLSLEENDKMVESMSYKVLAELNNKKGNYPKAEEYAKKANTLSKEIESKEFLKEDYLLLSEIYENKRDYRTALEYHKLFSGIQDSLYNEENLKQLTQMQQLFETEKKEKEISLLTKEKQLQEAELEKKIQQLDKNKIVTYSIAGGSVLVLLLLVVVYSRYQLKQKANNQLEKQKREIIIQRDEISLKNKEITDSINYARKIQDALLPPRESMATMFPQSFVLYLPKDIVSGDFFWIDEKNGNKMIAVADCTGHGVPGGFMSVLGMEKLSEAGQSCEDPSQMLNYLNVFIKKALQQNNEEGSRDGMDIAICSFDERSGKLSYSGANRPLWILRDKEIKEIAPDKTAIGGHTPANYEFRLNEVPVNKGDTVYLFSDGYADQFGGEKKKKLMTKAFRELLLQISGLPMNEQKDSLLKHFTQWRGPLEQVDDVLVIGVRL